MAATSTAAARGATDGPADRVGTHSSIVPTGSADLVYFSSVSGNTHRFMEKLGRPAHRIPLLPREEHLRVTEPFVLVTPTYGGGGRGAVPAQVIRFLNDPDNRALIRGVIGAGNTNFGESYCEAGDVIAAKCAVPHLYRFEVFGTPDDVSTVGQGLDQFWTQQ